jgi:predicted RNase H-like HicB family nuclease
MKDKAYYQNLDYEIVLRQLSDEDGGGFFAYYKDFPGVMGDGKSADDAMQDVKEAFDLFLDTALQQGIEIKEPSHMTRTKRINITVPLHALEEIDRYAEAHGINRSAFLVESALARVNAS